MQFFSSLAIALVLGLFVLPFKRVRAGLFKMWMMIFIPSAWLFHGFRMSVAYDASIKGGSKGLPKSAIYIANHSSSLDFLTCTRTMPFGTVAVVGDKELTHQAVLSLHKASVLTVPRLRFVFFV